jgi:hypothetical protein
MIHITVIIEHGSDEFTQLAAASRALFGNQDRLVIALAVADQDEPLVFARSIAASLRIADTRVALQLKALEAAGVLFRHPRPPGQKHQYFERLEGCFWPFVGEFAADVMVGRRAPR